MGICFEEALDQMKLSTLVVLCRDELKHARHREGSEGQHCLELLRRALVEETDEAWYIVEQCFNETIRYWIHTHPYRDVVLLRDSEENYLAQTYTRFWYAMREQHLAFTSLYAALSYLRATLSGVVMDTLRSYLRTRSREVPLPEPGLCDELWTEETLESQSLWESLQKLLVNERERRLFSLLYYCGLKPREVVTHCPGEFTDVQEIYYVNANMIARFRRNREQLRYLLGSDQ